MPHRRHTRTVQSYSLGYANASFSQPESITQTASRLVQTFLRSSWHGVSGLHLIHGSLSQPDPQPKRHLDRFSRFCTAHDGDRPTERQTDRPTDHSSPSVTIDRIYVVLFCSLLI